jgi:hypothetical protein
VRNLRTTRHAHAGQPDPSGEPATTRRGGLLLCLFGAALAAFDVGLVILFWHDHFKMVGVLMYVPAGVGLLFFLAGLSAVLRPTTKRGATRSGPPPS